MKNFFNKLSEIIIKIFPFLESLLLILRGKRVINNYRRTRTHYYKIMSQKKIFYSDIKSNYLIHERITKKGYNIEEKKLGQITTFSFIPNIGWHYQLISDLMQLGPLIHFDYTQYGFNLRELMFDKRLDNLNKMNDIAFEYLKKINSKNKIDWVFIYASGAEISPNFLKKISNNLGIPIVVMCLDDKQSWNWGKF